MMDFEDSGIDSALSDKSCAGTDFDFLSQKNEPIISFSPDRCRFESNGPRTSISGGLDITDLVMASPPTISQSGFEKSPPALNPEREVHPNGVTKEPESFRCTLSQSQNQSQLQRRLERHIAQASAVGLPKPHQHENGRSDQSFSPPMTASQIAGSLSTTGPGLTTSGPDSRKVPGLLPPQRLAIPHKSGSGSSATHPHRTQEFKPLVQWGDSDESEEELSFFPAPKSRSTLNDNLSIDNLSLSGEDDDLHLSPPRVTKSRCPCDPRLLIDSKFSKASAQSTQASRHHAKQCALV